MPLKLGSFLWLFKAWISHYWRRPWQTLFLFLGLVCGVGLWSAVQIVNDQAQQSYQDAERLLGSQADFWIQNPEGMGIPLSLYLEIRRAGILDVFPVLEFEVATPNAELIQILATDLMVIPGDGAFSSENPIQSSREWLKFIQPPYQAWFPSELASNLQLSEGAQLELRDGRSLPPALIREGGEQGERVIMDLGAALALEERDSFSYLAVGPIQPEQQAQLEQLLPMGFELVENRQALDLKELTQSLHTHLTAMSLLSFAVGLFIVFNAVRFSLWYRRKTFLNLRLLGGSRRSLTLALVLETLLWSLIGAAAGFYLGILLAQILLPGVSKSLQGLYGASVESLVSADLQTFALAWLITLLGLIWALFWPLYSQFQRRALEASRTTHAETDNQRTNRRQGALGFTLALLAFIFYPWVDSSVDGFLTLALILFAAAFTLPQILSWTTQTVARIAQGQNFFRRWIFNDGLAQLPALRSAMMALLLALIANVGVGVLVDSFRLSFTDWLSARQSADIYLRSSQVDYQELIDKGQAEGWLEDSHQRYGVSLRWQDRPARVRGMDPVAPDSKELPLAQWLGDTPTEALDLWRYGEDTVLINEQLQYLAGVSLGDRVSLETEQGTKSFRVVGIFYDYGNPYFQFYLPEQRFKALWQNYYDSGLALWLTAEHPEILDQALEDLRQLGVSPSDWITQKELRRISIGIFDQTFAITAVMNTLTLLVAVIALLASLLAIMHQRLPELAQWRALGLHRRELLMIIFVPLLIFCVLTWLIALPIGSLLGWVLIHKMNQVSFGWSMPVYWDVFPMIQLGGAVLLIVCLAVTLVALLSRRRLARSLANLGEVI